MQWGKINLPFEEPFEALRLINYAQADRLLETSVSEFVPTAATHPLR